MSTDLFELELLGGATEQRFRRMRPEVEDMPWGTLDLSAASEEAMTLARSAWTGAAYQEYRTALACAVTLKALIEARAPVDLIAVASRFPLDEMVHVELAARMAMEFGGGSEIVYDAQTMVVEPDPEASPFLQAAECAVRFFCVGEAISIPLLRETWHIAEHPLPKAVMGRIVKDEAAHGRFGFTFLDWAEPRLGQAEKAALGKAADRAIRFLYRQWRITHEHRRSPLHEGDVLGWMKTDDYLMRARRAMQSEVIAPLEARGIPISAQLTEAASHGGSSERALATPMDPLIA